jgi:hypothetical protein
MLSTLRPIVHTGRPDPHALLRVVLARTRVALHDGESSALLGSLAAAIEAGLRALQHPADFVALDRERALAGVDADFPPDAIMAALLRLAVGCAAEDRLEAAERIVAWLRKAARDSRLIDLVWALLLRQTRPDDPAAWPQRRQPGGDAIDQLVRAVLRFPDDPEGAVQELHDLHRRAAAGGLELSPLTAALEALAGAQGR